MTRPKKVRRSTVGQLLAALIEVVTAKEKHRIYSQDQDEKLDAEDQAAQERFRVAVNDRVEALLNLADD